MASFSHFGDQYSSLLSGHVSTYDASNGPPLHVQLTLALARHLPTEPVFWIVMIAGTSVALWILLLRAFRNIDITFDTPRSAT